MASTLPTMPAERARPTPCALALLALAALLVAGCGGAESGAAAKDPITNVPPSVRSGVAAARDVAPSSFPKAPAGISLEQFAGRFDTRGPQAVAASSVLRTPENRVAFGLLDSQQRFVYGQTVVYMQRRGATGPIEGPIPAPADVLVTAPRFRSQQAASETDPFAAIY